MESRLNNYIKIFSIIFTGILSVGVAIPCYGYDNNEVKVSIKRDVKEITLIAGIDYRHDGSQLFRRHYDAGAKFPLSFLGDGWSFAAHYRNVYTKSDDGTWDLEKRPYGQLQKTFRTSATEWFPDLKWGIRTRQEFRFKENREDTTRNRSRIEIKSGKAYLKVKPFISNEFFFDFDEGKYNKNRTILGIGLPKFKGATSSIYFKFVTEIEDGDDDHTSSLVFKVGF
jgi:hypothetical protein